jgi:SAM-dependent methyltransferase
MPNDNADQIAEWNGVQGRSWAERHAETEAVVAPFGDAALEVAAPRRGEHVLDIGCGCGDTSLAIARAVGPTGAVLGVDVSQPMLDVALAQARRERFTQLEFRNADASSAELPRNCDLLFSRFGVMFFSAPAPAFAHMRASLRPGGRCVFACWRAPRDNAWAMLPLSAARTAMGVTPPPADANAPGPFAFADEARLHGILADAGFADIAMTRRDLPMALGATPRAAAERQLRFGPTSRFVREVGEEHAPVIVAAVEKALTPFAAADGSVVLTGSAWIVTARSPVNGRAEPLTAT